jgi:hypothetical protein
MFSQETWFTRCIRIYCKRFVHTCLFFAVTQTFPIRKYIRKRGKYRNIKTNKKTCTFNMNIYKIQGVSKWKSRFHVCLKLINRRSMIYMALDGGKSEVSLLYQLTACLFFFHFFIFKKSDSSRKIILCFGILVWNTISFLEQTIRLS